MRLTNRDWVKIKMIINIDYDLKGSILDIGGGGEAIIGQKNREIVYALPTLNTSLCLAAYIGRNRFIFSSIEIA